MELKFDVTGTQRKEMVSIISDTVHMKAVYKFMPTCAYVIDNMTVSKEGTLLWDERTSQETIDAVLAALTAAGFSYEGEKQEPEQPAADESGLTVSLPRDGFSDIALENLNCLLDAKGTLIKKALGISGMATEVSSWRKVADDKQRGGQIDLVIKRADRIVHLCEMKFSKSEYRITDAYEQLLRQRIELFQSSTKTKLSLVITFVTTYGVADGLHHSIVHSEVTMSQLFIRNVT